MAYVLRCEGVCSSLGLVGTVVDWGWRLEDEVVTRVDAAAAKENRDPQTTAEAECVCIIPGEMVSMEMVATREFLYRLWRGCLSGPELKTRQWVRQDGGTDVESVEGPDCGVATKPTNRSGVRLALALER